uniref:DSBA-like thioredoxin domain-containing protein n=1 Tax=Eucampia antarctica TaxID=49252 RepID=A0A7S2RC54_9STRA|mmetsp:Transcript_20041/g.19298  ORF Transcript_20041/g.19298 Transcript_20041/m.19298 type:complete len:259 (+) Transcript_20041:221-997(+)|eukprot:CAMPEP_0197828540 /NCGR_PEP_ID=MMETSP1437-20131217/5081_1 /TAXON_ID=49252 ORGANISM="Eucampia antarctica, Strain CCMP1452" /NCGR_SAMPLE_ID=MMETSP1437 /ASSEMBLY_ACC=CAM_ASM_001096 /LENGTH=258 /DNA_ID=CAMNT_0043429777 /DNA_START=315 /DNA_END=1091 /DNA_ORIENTATION=+
MREVLESPLPNAPNPIAFSVLRVPFFLEPHYDENKASIESNRQRLIQKWGGTAGWERQKSSHDLKGRGMEAGIPHFNLDRLTSNTMASHRLIQHVGKKYGLRVSEGLYDRLNVYYFVDGHALNDRPRLAKVASEELQKLVTTDDDNIHNNSIMTEGQILDFLNGNQGRVEILKALRTLDDIGVHGIPKFIIGGKSVIDGAAKSPTFLRIFRSIEQGGKVAFEDEHEQPRTIFGEILGVSEDIIRRGSHTRENIDVAFA